MTARGSKVRAFFALLPDRDTRGNIRFHAAQCSPETGNAVATDNYHITLLFLGNVAPQQLDALCVDCDGISLPPFRLTIDTPGWWQKAGIFWLGPASTPPALTTLHDTLARLAVRRQMVPDRHRFIPHITLMRQVRHAPQYPVMKPFTWQADHFSLMQSDLRPEGVRYTEIARWPLNGAG